MEWLDVVDGQGNPTGAQVDRENAHRNGIRHRTAHVWLLRRRAETVELLLQKRSEKKDSNPGCYDISSAGHIPAGDDFFASALRELREELGLDAEPDALIDCGLRVFFHRGVFHGRPFLDNQVSRVFALWYDVEPEQMHLQHSEVTLVRWVPFDACLAGVRAGTFPNCIDADELEMVRRACFGTP